MNKGAELLWAQSCVVLKHDDAAVELAIECVEAAVLCLPVHCGEECLVNMTALLAGILFSQSQS